MMIRNHTNKQNKSLTISTFCFSFTRGALAVGIEWGKDLHGLYSVEMLSISNEPILYGSGTSIRTNLTPELTTRPRHSHSLKGGKQVFIQMNTRIRNEGTYELHIGPYRFSQFFFVVLVSISVSFSVTKTDKWTINWITFCSCAYICGG